MGRLTSATSTPPGVAAPPSGAGLPASLPTSTSRWATTRKRSSRSICWPRFHTGPTPKRFRFSETRSSGTCWLTVRRRATAGSRCRKLAASAGNSIQRSSRNIESTPDKLRRRDHRVLGHEVDLVAPEKLRAILGEETANRLSREGGVGIGDGVEPELADPVPFAHRWIDDGVEAQPA